MIGSAYFALGVEVEDRLVDGLVRGAVEVMALDDLHDIGDGVLGQEHAAEDRLLGIEVLGRHPLETGRSALPTAALPAAFVLLAAVPALTSALPGNGQTVAGTGLGPGVVQRLGNTHRATSSRPLRGPRHATLSYGTAPTNKTPDSGSGASSSEWFRVGNGVRAPVHGRPLSTVSQSGYPQGMWTTDQMLWRTPQILCTERGTVLWTNS